MYYGNLFFDILVIASLVSLIGVFAFQIWAFLRDRNN